MSRAPIRSPAGNETQRSGSGRDAPGETSGLALELYRLTPNPFTATTTIAYAVNTGEGADVQIGVDNVAGRVLRSCERLPGGGRPPGLMGRSQR